LQFPHDDQVFSESENLDIENFLNTQGNVQLKASFSCVERTITKHSRHHGKWAKNG
jgi:hypothetical protein